MPGLSIIVTSADGARLTAALETAMAAAALGSPARLFLQGAAAALIRAPVAAADDAAREAAGLPGLAAIIDEAAEMEVALFACQSGMALAGLSAEAMVPQARAAGLVSFLQGMGEQDRLIVY